MLGLSSVICNIVTFLAIVMWAYTDKKRYKFLSNEITRLNKEIISLKRSQSVLVVNKFKHLEASFWRKYKSINNKKNAKV